MKNKKNFILLSEAPSEGPLQVVHKRKKKNTKVVGCRKINF